VLSTFLTDSYYEKAGQTLCRFLNLLNETDPEFAAKLAIFARNECGMRLVSHVIAAKTARLVKGKNWVRRFIKNVVRRPDDAIEILAFYLNVFGRPVPNSLKKGPAFCCLKKNFLR